jgi:hypothetical protein
MPTQGTYIPNIDTNIRARPTKGRAQMLDAYSWWVEANLTTEAILTIFATQPPHTNSPML